MGRSGSGRRCMGSPRDGMVGRGRSSPRSSGSWTSWPSVPGAAPRGRGGDRKTTLWRAGLAAAAGAGHRVLVSRPGERETTLAYSAIGDLLGDVFDEALADAPAPQRRALEIALLRRGRGTLQPISGRSRSGCSRRSGR